MTWVDTHCHLQLDDRPPAELLDRADEVDWLVAPGVDAASSRAGLRLAQEFPGRVLATAGLHPHEAENWPREESEIVRLADEVSAIGETGLDFYRNLSPRDSQLTSFEAQIQLAEDKDLPLIVHCRDAFADVHDLIERHAVGDRAILHCWTGGTRWTKRFLLLGVTFSFAGPVAFETGDTIRRGAALVPPELALIETDTPYLAPPPHRREQNEPAWVSYVGGALAKIWGMAVPDVARVTSDNAARMFLK